MRGPLSLTRPRWRGGFAAAALLVFVPVAGAQVTGDRDPPRDTTVQAADSVTPARLPQVVVSALRLPTEIATAGYAMARNGPDMTRRARPGLALGESLFGLPGVQVDNRYNFALGERITIRGFGARTQFGVRGVRVLVDGIPATMPDGQTTLNHLDLGAISSVEVVRTPIAGLHGNAAGGVITMHTASPPAGRLISESRVVSGSHGLLRTETGIGGTSEHTGYALRVARLDYDGYRSHNSAENRYLTARTSSKFGAASIDATAHQVRYDALNPGALPDSLLQRDRNAAFPTNIAQHTGERGKHSQLGLTLTAPLGAQRVTTAAYMLRRTVDNPIPPRIIDLSRRAGGARASIGSDAAAESRIHWDAGIEGALQRDNRLNHQNVSGERGTLVLDQDERVRTVAGFAAARARLSPDVEALVGIRRDVVTFEAEDHLVTATNPDDSGERSMSAWSPSIGVSLRLRRDLHLFANVGTAFETPTTTELANQPTGAGGFNAGLNPQRTVSGELGVNGATGWWYYQFVMHRARVSEALVPFEVPGVPGRQFFRNAGSASHNGTEIMFGVAAGRGVSGRLTYSYLSARYREYVVNELSYRGNRVPGVTPHRLDALLRLSGRNVFVDIESRYHSKVVVDDANATFSPVFAIHGVRAGMTHRSRRRFALSPYLAVENVFGRLYNSSVVVNAAAGRFFEPGPGRTFFLGTDLRFAVVP